MRDPFVAAREFIVDATIVGGLGRSATGLDRGEVGPSLLCRADSDDTSGEVIVTACNTTYGHSGATAAERAAAAASFAESALARCPVPAPGSFDPAPLGLVDLVGIGQRLTDAADAPFVLDRTLSRLDRVEWHGDVLAIESVLVFRAAQQKPRPKYTTGHSPRVSLSLAPPIEPAPGDTVSVRQQVAVRPLPPPGYEPVPLDPTVGATSSHTVHRFDLIDGRDAETPLATRFRTTEPIVFHLDPAMPPAIREAVLEGGNWWQDAFEAAGLPGAYRVEPLPDGADLTDPRRNVVLWVHRADRGWSMGMTQADPRTGEILRAVVRLGSQRVEQLRAITESVLAPYADDDGATAVADVVAARVRQLAAHEIGHGLGFAHNFASHRHSRPSVMDYPGPAFAIDGDRPVAPAPYATGLGPWDRYQVAALYGTVAAPPDLDYVTDADARTDDAADACGATWIAPGDPVTALTELLAVRAAALRRFGPAVVPPGSDANEIERRFLVLYLLHRHQATAVAKLVGGSERRYAVTDGASFTGAATPVPEERQRAALTELTALLTPEFLDVPAHIRPLLVGPAGGRPRREGQFDHRTAGAFDQAAAIAAGTDVVAGPLLAPARLNRVAESTGPAELLAATVGHAIGLLTGTARDLRTETIGWTLLRRFEHTLTDPELHHHTRVAAVEAIATGPWFGDPGRPAVTTRWKALTHKAFEDPAELPGLPPGTPI
ncbi:MAG: zinc-dependent metalloprotease [Actinophytocola sp.]|uniref:zinc-dependent metalloprotease n=1 Tax=Actinophytocola sp. TaxID=1872138 RepID=UPI003C727121